MSYLNTKPLLHGLQNSPIFNSIELSVNYPSMLARQLRENELDMALMPVAAMKEIEGARIVSNYGIATDGNVVSVALFSRVPIEEIKSIFLDYQSRTSVKLAQVLMQNYWKKDVEWLQANEHYIDYITGNKAGVIIGDRALVQLNNFEYVYDLSAAWKAFTGLDFVFAAWIANKDIDPTFLARFDQANAAGLTHLDEVIAQNPFPYYDLKTYYTENIVFELDARKKAGLEKFLEYL